MLRPALAASISIILPKLIFEYVKFIYKGIISLFKNSLLYRLSVGFSGKIGTYFTYSIFGSITQRRNTEYPVLCNSRLALFFTNRAKWCKNALLGHSGASKTQKALKSIQGDFILSPLRIAGIVIISAIAANIFLDIIFNNDVPVLGWVTRSMFIVAGVITVFCKTDLRVLKNSSFIIKRIFS